MNKNEKNEQTVNSSLKFVYSVEYGQIILYNIIKIVENELGDEQNGKQEPGSPVKGGAGYPLRRASGTDSRELRF